MQIAGITNFNMTSLEHIPQAKVTVPKIEKKEPTVHNSSIPYPFHKPTFEDVMKNHARMQAMFQEMFKDVKQLEFEDYVVYDVHGEKSELKIIKRHTDDPDFPKLDVKV